MKVRWLVLLGFVIAIGCSSPSSSEKQAKPGAPFQPPKTAAASNNPAAKYIELVGFRINEKSPGHLEVQFGVVNHSEADIGDITMTVNVRTTTAKPDDPPVITFSAKVPSLGPEELKPMSVEVPTKLRVYELPDWQFLKSDFQITEPQ